MFKISIRAKVWAGEHWLVKLFCVKTTDAPEQSHICYVYGGIVGF